MRNVRTVFPVWVCAALIASLASGVRAEDWSDLTPSSGAMPAPRTQCSAVFDTQNRNMVIFGGQGATGPLNDVWAFDLDANTWTNLTPVSGPAPAPRLTPASVYDPIGHRMLTWSGQGVGGVFFNDVWSFDLTTLTWSQQAPTGGPPNIRYGVAWVFDPVGRELVTFAGFTSMGRFDDVWRYDADAITWTNVSPGTGPLRRCLHTASYDSQDHRMIMYGGQNAGALADIWAFDLAVNTWMELTPATSPTGRFFAASIYDSPNHRLIVFGGSGGAGKNNEALAFDLTTNSWSTLAPGGTPPSARDGSAAIHDGALDRMVVFGGHDGAWRNDVWALENLTNPVGVSKTTPARALALRSAPNPARPGAPTSIHFDLPRGGHATLRVYDVRGRFLRTLLAGDRPAGANVVTWDGRDAEGNSLKPGVYWYRLDAGGSATRKLVLTR